MPDYLFWIVAFGMTMALIGFVALVFGVRNRLIRRTYGDLQEVYHEYDMPIAVLRDTICHGDLYRINCLSLQSAKGNWEFLLESRGLKRLFYLVRIFDLIDASFSRLRERGGFILGLHVALFILLCAGTVLKVLVRPSVRDIRMLVGFDSIAAAREARSADAMTARMSMKLDSRV